MVIRYGATDTNNEKTQTGFISTELGTGNGQQGYSKPDKERCGGWGSIRPCRRTYTRKCHLGFHEDKAESE